MKLAIVEWWMLSCGHRVDLTQRELEIWERATKLVCPKCCATSRCSVAREIVKKEKMS